MTNLEFGQNIEKLRPELRSFTHRFTSDREESQDLVQDTILKALTNRDKFRVDTNLRGWLFTIMRNTYINNYRKTLRVKTSHHGAGEWHMLNIEDHHTFSRPDGNMEFREVWRSMNSIKDELLTPFRMYTSGYKYDEIAKHLRIPVGTVKNRIFHARKEIQKKLVGYR